MAGKAENEVENAILEWLNLQPHATFISTRRIFLGRRKSKHVPAGLGDVIGCWRGLYVEIEVKTDHGVASEQQLARGEYVRARGGIAFIARSVEDVRQVLRQSIRAPGGRVNENLIDEKESA